MWVGMSGPGENETQVSQLRAIVIQAFIMCRLDYCNSLPFGVTDDVLERLQAAENAAARLVSAARRSDHITIHQYSNSYSE